MLRGFKQCRRKWWLEWIHGYHLSESSLNPVNVAGLGTRIHTALEAYYGYGLDPLAALRATYMLDVQRHPVVEDELWRQYDLAKVMLKGYLDWSQENGTDVGLEVVATEQRVERELDVSGTTVILVAKLDQQIRRHLDGALLFRDWKTVGSLSKAHLLVLDEQMRMYAMLQWLDATDGQELPAGGLYTMLLRSKRTVRARGPFYQQIPVSFNEEDHRSMLLRVTGVVGDMLQALEMVESGVDHRKVMYPNPGDYCGWGCPFTLVCPLFDDGSRAWDAVKANFVRRDPYQYHSSDTIDQVRAMLAPGMKDGE